MSRRRSTVSGRRVTVAVTLLLVIGVAVPAVLARTAGLRAGAPAAAAATAAEEPTTAPQPAGTPLPREPVEEPPALPEPPDDAATDAIEAAEDDATPPKPDRTVLSDAQLAAARQVAADFAAAYATYRYDESAEDAAARLTPWTTPELAEQLRNNAGGTAGRAVLEERRQIAEALVETVTVQRVNGSQVDVAVVVKQTVTSVDGSETRWPSYLTRVERGAEGWRVAAFQP